MRVLFLWVCSLLIACGSTSDGIDAPPGDDAAGDGSGLAVVDLTFANHPTDPAMFEFAVMFQDGAGPWTVAPAPNGNLYSLPIASGRYGFAWTCRAAGGSGLGVADLRIVRLGYFTVAEHPALVERLPPGCSERPTGLVTLAGTVTNRGGAARFTASFGGVSVLVEPGTGQFALQVEPGTHDLVIARSTNGGTVGDVVVVRSVVIRGLAVTTPTTRDVDFSTAVDAQTFAVTVITTGQQRSNTVTSLVTAGGTEILMVDDTAAPFETNALAIAQADAGDVYDTIITVAGAGQAATTSTAATTPTATTFVAPQALGGATATVTATTPYPQITSTWQPYPNAIGYRWTANQNQSAIDCGGNAGCTVTWSAELSPGYTGTTTELVMPDLSAVSGWTATHQFVAGTMIVGDAQAITSSAGASDFPIGPPIAGTQRTNVRSTWTATP